MATVGDRNLSGKINHDHSNQIMQKVLILPVDYIIHVFPSEHHILFVRVITVSQSINDDSFLVLKSLIDHIAVSPWFFVMRINLLVVLSSIRSIS